MILSLLCSPANAGGGAASAEGIQSLCSIAAAKGVARISCRRVIFISEQITVFELRMGVKQNRVP